MLVWHRIVRRYWTRWGDESQDIAQEAAIAALAYAREHPQDGDFANLMGRIAHCLAVNMYRRRAVRPTTTIDRLAELAIPAGYDVELENRDLVAHLPINPEHRPALERWMRGEQRHGRGDSQTDRKYVFRAVRSCRESMA